MGVLSLALIPELLSAARVQPKWACRSIKRRSLKLYKKNRKNSRWCSIIELIILRFPRGIIADRLKYEFREETEAALDPDELTEICGGWYRAKELSEWRFWSTLLNAGAEGSAYIEYREINEGGAIIFKADWADISDKRLPVEDCRSISICWSGKEGNWGRPPPEKIIRLFYFWFQ